MENNRIIQSEYFDLRDAYKLNKFLEECSLNADFGGSNPHPNKGNSDVAEFIANCCMVKKDYREIDKYVKDSPTYLEIERNNKDYLIAQEFLKKCNHIKELVLDEIYIGYLQIYKHTYQEVSNKHGEHLETYTFYTTNDMIIIDCKDYQISYFNRNNDKDLIKEACSEITHLNKIINYYELAKRLTSLKKLDEPVTFDDLYRIFGYDFEFYTTMNTTRYKSDDLYNFEILTLVKEYRIAKNKKYIRGDMYVDYPSFYNYLEFKEILLKENGEYKEIKEDLTEDLI